MKASFAILTVATLAPIAVVLFAQPVFAAPYSRSEISAVETSQEAKVRELRDQEITQLRIALGRRLAQNRRADLYFRLAEIYVEAYRAAFLLEGRAHEKRLQQGLPDKTIDRNYSKPFLAAGIQASQEVLKIGIATDKLDQIHYFLGFSYSELGDRKKSIQMFQALAQRFPGSPFAAEAYRELGEDAFAKGDFRKAQAYYEMALRRSTADDRPRTLHKLAWSYYRTKQYARAVATMKDAVSSAEKSGERFLSLREEALRDMAVFMTETGQVDEAIAYFQSVADKSFYPSVLEKLGKQYERNVEPSKATQVYESLLKTQPGSEAAFRVRVKLVDLDLRRGRFQEALKRLNGDLMLDGGEEETRVAAQNLRAMVRRTATEHHEKFRKKSAKADLEISEDYYQAYLQYFLSKDDPRNETPEIRMYLAEVKRELGKSAEASALYRQVVDSRDKRYAKEAGALWTSSLSEAIRDAAKSAQKKHNSPSEMEKEYIEASDRLQDALDGTVEAREHALKAAQVFAGYSETHDEAIKRSKKIIEKWPRTQQALTAARLWVQILSDRVPQGAAIAKAEQGNVENLSETLEQVRANGALLAADKEIGAGKLRAQLEDQEERIRIWRIARQEEDKDFGAAAKGYETLAASTSRKDFAEKAYGSAVSAYLRSGDLESVDRILSSWWKRFPGTQSAGEMARSVATTLLIQGKHDQSARIFEKIGKELQDPDSLATAARIYESLPDPSRAASAWAYHLAHFPKAKDRWKGALALGLIQQGLAKDSEARKSFELCMSGPDEYEALCGIRMSELYARNKDNAQVDSMLKKVATGKRSKKGDSSSAYVAYARFQLADALQSGSRFTKLQLPEAALKKGMQERLTFLEPLSRAYMSAVEAGGPWAVAALGNLAAWALNFANEVDAITPPASYDGEAIAKFRTNLESISGPLRKKAIATWSEGYATAVSAEALSPMLPELADHLADFRVPSPGRAQGPKGKFRIAGIAADGGDRGREKSLEAVRAKLASDPRDSAAWVDYGNLLWGEGKSLLSKLAYERALALNPKNPAALNNRAVVELSGAGQEDWIRAAEASQLLQEALKQDPFFLPAKFNRASLLNYYRLFAKARPLWEQVLAKDTSADAHSGLAIALQGLGETSHAVTEFRKAAEKGASDSDFAWVYHEAARVSFGGPEGASDCLDNLDELDATQLQGFEKRSVEYLRGTCTQWKRKK